MDGVIETLRWAMGGIFLLLFLALALYNWTMFWRGFVLRQHAESWIPLLGGALGALGIVEPGRARKLITGQLLEGLYQMSVDFVGLRDPLGGQVA